MKSVPLSQPSRQRIPISSQEQAEFGNNIAGHTVVVPMEARVVTTKPKTTRITPLSKIEWVVGTKKLWVMGEAQEKQDFISGSIYI